LQLFLFSSKSKIKNLSVVALAKLDRDSSMVNRFLDQRAYLKLDFRIEPIQPQRPTPAVLLVIPTAETL
jgi:hypothetical protein